jgi:hypothetical protein
VLLAEVIKGCATVAFCWSFDDLGKNCQRDKFNLQANSEVGDEPGSRPKGNPLLRGMGNAYALPGSKIWSFLGIPGSGLCSPEHTPSTARLLGQETVWTEAEDSALAQAPTW